MLRKGKGVKKPEENISRLLRTFACLTHFLILGLAFLTTIFDRLGSRLGTRLGDRLDRRDSGTRIKNKIAGGIGFRMDVEDR